MGFSILMIVLYHFCNCGGTTLTDKGFRTLFSQGYVGVDIFFVLSGLGLTYSLLKDGNLKRYYLKRWIRIFPFFTFITLIECWIIQGESFEIALLRSTTLGYWIGFPYIDWYIPALVGIYTIFPILFYVIIKPRRLLWAFIISIGFFVVAIIIVVLNITSIDWKHFALIYRVPDFLLGCMSAVAIKDGYKKNSVRKYVFISTIIGVWLLATMWRFNHGIWLANMCFTPLYLSLLLSLLNKLSTVKGGNIINNGAAFIGLFTFELYRVSSSFERLLVDEACPNNHIFFVMLYLTISIIISYILYLAFSKINDILYRNIK